MGTPQRPGGSPGWISQRSCSWGYLLGLPFSFIFCTFQATSCFCLGTTSSNCKLHPHTPTPSLSPPCVPRSQEPVDSTGWLVAALPQQHPVTRPPHSCLLTSHSLPQPLFILVLDFKGPFLPRVNKHHGAAVPEQTPRHQHCPLVQILRFQVSCQVTVPLASLGHWGLHGCDSSGHR